MLSFSTQLLYDRAVERGYIVDILDEKYNILHISHNDKSLLFKNIDGWANGSFWFKVARRKILTQQLLEWLGYPFPKMLVLEDESDLESIKWELWLSFPVVVKPEDMSGGIWVTCGVMDREGLVSAGKEAFTHTESWKILVQEQIVWDDYRIMVVWDEIVAITKRLPPFVVWDWISTIEQLVLKENKHPERGAVNKGSWATVYTHLYVQIPLDDIAMMHISQEYGYDFSSVPSHEEYVVLRWNSNAWTGGTYMDIPVADLHPETYTQVMEICRWFGVTIWAVDVMTSDISRPLGEVWGAFLEVSPTPGLFGEFPNPDGTIANRDVEGKILDFYFLR